jgi:bifunctional UDP-N-acetylglucosamine pyrophosphorylase/glucosamine-1-phosphate N-acetyltransferase
MNKIAIIILAAGKGTRMLSKKQKIVHEVGGKPMVQHVFDAARSVATEKPVLVVGPGELGVQNLIGDRGQYVVQEERLGTGHATMVAEALVKGQADQVIVTYADMPLLRSETLQRLADDQAESGAAVVLMSVIGEPASTFGRIVRDPSGNVIEICEVAEARQRPNGDDILAMTELNAGVYCFSAEFLWQNIHNLPLRQARSGNEYYLTDMIEFAVQQNAGVRAIITDDPDECLGAGTRAEMVHVEKAFRRRTNNHWLANGVTLVDPDTTFIDVDVQIGQDTIIWPNSYIQGNTIIGEDCVIGPSAVIRNTHLTDGTVVPPFTVID